MSLIRIGEITTKPTRLNNTGKPYYIFTGATFDGGKGTIGDYYTEITSNKSWMEIGVKNYDYSFCRTQVMTWTAINNFSALTTEEKVVAATHFAVGPADRDTVLTNEEQQEAWSDLIIKTRKSRQLRWDAAESYISFTIPMPDSIDLGKSTNTLSNEYIIYGVESFEKSGEDGLFDWLGNTSAFSGGTGYNGKSYWTQEHQDKMLDILKNGNY